MKFSIVVYAAPYSSEAASTAYNFTKTLLDEGHEVYRLFFFSDGVHNASSLAITPQDETNLQKFWDALIQNHELDSVVCVTSAVKRGIINQQEAERHELAATSLLASSEIAGLGQLIDAAINSDRVVNFG
ncbi:MAG: sulfurtransferase complex subunit TusD [Gammaproteobacteria bacterium]|nr:sulfurtransferase complex subunit TusD [Gammaproteobacteria bacterium]MDD9958640.1 sulfurtransferase complex subunit TusD [Gammaproteobacteria bacterium]